MLLKHDGDRIEHVVTVGDDGEFAAAFAEQLTARPMSELKLWEATERQRRPVFVENAAASRLLPSRLVERLGLRSYAAVPLLSEGRPIGVVILSHSIRSRAWDEEDRRLASQLALEGSLVIENAALRAVEHERMDSLTEQAFHDPLTELPNRALLQQPARARVCAHEAPARRRSPFCSWISTASSRSTTTMAMRPGTACSWPSAGGCRRACARRTRSLAWAGTSSPF